MKRFCLILLLFSQSALASLKVTTTTSNLADLVKQIGGKNVEVESLCHGMQDPHFLEAKPSYTFRLSKADLLISVGGGLEVGWLPLLIAGSRRPEFKVGGSRHLVAANSIKLIEQVSTNITRAMGDVHPEGNPHFMLSPVKSKVLAKKIAGKLSELDPDNKATYVERLKTYTRDIDQQVLDIKKRLMGLKRVVSYHRTLSYFFKDFDIEIFDVLEPKPGVPPSAKHILELSKKMKNAGVTTIVIENYFSEDVAKKIKSNFPKVRIITVPVSVGGHEDVSTLFLLYDYLSKALEVKNGSA